MTIETALYDVMRNHAGVSALVSTRIYPNRLPQNVTFPAISWRWVTAQRFPCMSTDGNLRRRRLQCDIWAETIDSAWAVRDALDACLCRYTAASPVQIYDIALIGSVDLFEEDTEIHHIANDYNVTYSES